MECNSVFFEYLKNNKKIFLRLISCFIIGIIVGVVLINNSSNNQTNEINEYINQLVDNIKNNDNIDKNILLMQALKKKIIFVVFIWILGCTIFGSFLVYIVILYKGFTFGYTISAIIASLGIKSGVTFVLSGLAMQNLILIPFIVVMAESSIKVFQNLKFNKYVNIKKEIFRHTIVMLIVIVLSILSAFIEVYISTNLLIFFKEIF